MNANVEYTFKKGKDGCIVTVKPNRVPEKELYETAVPDSFEAVLVDLLKKYRVGRWNGFNKFEKRIADGRSFTLNAALDNGRSISAHGYMKFPAGYREFRQEADDLFMPLYQKALPED